MSYIYIYDISSLRVKQINKSGDHKIYYCTKHAEPKIMSKKLCELCSKNERNNADMQHMLNGVRQRLFVITKKRLQGDKVINLQ